MAERPSAKHIELCVAGILEANTLQKLVDTIVAKDHGVKVLHDELCNEHSDASYKNDPLSLCNFTEHENHVIYALIMMGWQYRRWVFVEHGGALSAALSEVAEGVEVELPKLIGNNDSPQNRVVHVRGWGETMRVRVAKAIELLDTSIHDLVILNRGFSEILDALRERESSESDHISLNDQYGVKGPPEKPLFNNRVNVTAANMREAEYSQNVYLADLLAIRHFLLDDPSFKLIKTFDWASWRPRSHDHAPVVSDKAKKQAAADGNLYVWNGNVQLKDGISAANRLSDLISQNVNREVAIRRIVESEPKRFLSVRTQVQTPRDNVEGLLTDRAVQIASREAQTVLHDGKFERPRGWAPHPGFARWACLPSERREGRLRYSCQRASKSGTKPFAGINPLLSSSERSEGAKAQVNEYLPAVNSSETITGSEVQCKKVNFVDVMGRVIGRSEVTCANA